MDAAKSILPAFSSPVATNSRNTSFSNGADDAKKNVIEMNEVVEESYEMVEKGVMSTADLRAFMFENPVRLHGLVNPHFFDGTAVESEARKLLLEDEGREQGEVETPV